MLKLQEEKNRIYYTNEDNVECGEITYITVEELYIIDNTYVEEPYQGKGIAKKLVQAVVEKARKEGRKVVPVCPFANAEFERRMEYLDVKK